MNWNLDNKIIIQGLNYPDFLFSTKIMQDYGTNIVAGIFARYSGNDDYGFPIFDLVEQAIAEFGTIETSIILNNPYDVLDATLEAIASGIKQIIINSRGIPPLDLLQIFKKAKAKNVLILGPGKAGILVPEKICLGIIETQFYQPGEIAIINTGDWSLNYEIALLLNNHNLGQSIAINLGDDALFGSSIFSWLKIVKNYPKTEAIILVISDEKYLNKEETEIIIKHIASEIDKPLIVYLADKHRVKLLNSHNNNQMIADQIPFFLDKVSTRENIINAFNTAKITMVNSILEIPELVKKSLKKSH